MKDKLVGIKSTFQTKKRTREHVIADLSVNHVERAVLKCGWIADRVHFDYGYDLVVTTFDEQGQVQPGQIRLQLKATDHIRLSKNKSFLSFALDRRDVQLWLREVIPVILVVYDAQKERAFWLHLAGYFEDRIKQLFSKSGSVTVRIPTKNRINRQPDPVGRPSTTAECEFRQRTVSTASRSNASMLCVSLRWRNGGRLMNAQPTYGQLGELLESLGFSESSAADQFLGFEHSKTGTIFRFAPHAKHESVIPHDLVRVRRMLDLVNLLSSADFDSWCSRVSGIDTTAVG